MKTLILTKIKTSSFMVLLLYANQLICQPTIPIQEGGSWYLTQHSHESKIVSDLPGTEVYLVSWDPDSPNHNPERVFIQIDGTNNNIQYLFQGAKIFVESNDIKVIESNQNNTNKRGVYRLISTEELNAGVTTEFHMFGSNDQPLNNYKIGLTKFKFERYIRVSLDSHEDNITTPLRPITLPQYKFRLLVDGQVAISDYRIGDTVDVYGKEVSIELWSVPAGTNPSTYWFRFHGRYFVIN